MEINLPQGWVETKLHFICSINTGKWDANHAALDGKYRFYTCAFEYQFSNTKRFSGECIILPGNGANVGEVFFYDGEFDAYQRTYILSDLKINAKFAFYHLQFLWKEVNKEKQYGSATNYIRIGNFLDYNVPIPPLAEQHRIVVRLDAIMQKVESNKQRIEKIPKLLKRFRQSVLAASVSGKLTEDWREKNKTIEDAKELILNISSNRKYEYEIAIEKYKENKGKKPKTPTDINFIPLIKESDDIPTSWIVTRIGDVSECLDYIRKPINKTERLSRQGKIPYYGANGQVGWIDNYLFDEDLVVVVEDETFLGREIPFSYVIRGKTWVNNHAHVMRPLGGISVVYLNTCWSFYDFTPMTTGTTGRRKLTQGKLTEAEFPIAPFQEQKEIVHRVEQLFAFADKIEARYTKAKDMLDKLPQSILAKAFRGELVQQDPNDEPAGVLLERIKSEKKELVVKKNKKK